MRRCATALSVLLLSFAAGARADWQGYISLGSEYSYRGLRLTEDSAAVSTMLEYQWDSGIYAGVWLGNLDLPNNDPRSEEVNYLLGYSHRLSPHLALDTTLIHFHYPAANQLRDYDWDEWQLALHVDQEWTLRFGINDNWGARDKSARMLELTYRRPLPLGVTSDLTLGYNDVDSIIGTPYHYRELGLNRALWQLQLRLALTGADSRAKRLFGDKMTGNRWAFSATWVF